MEKVQETINKDLEELKNKHAETNNTTTEIKTNKQTKTQHISPYKKLTQTTGPTLEGETKKKKEFNLEAWKKETSNTISLKK